MNLSSYSPRGRKEETFRTEEQLAQGFEGSMPILCALLSSKSLSLSFSFLNLSPFALVILPVSLFTGKPPTPPDRDSSLPFPSRRDFLTYRFLEKVSFLETVFPNRGQPSSCKMTEVGGRYRDLGIRGRGGTAILVHFVRTLAPFLNLLLLS